MKLNDNNFDVQVVNADEESSSFSIAMNAKAFKVLSSTLYKDKIGSIVRELSCNAYDAHVAAGKKELPFEIHLPDHFEPWFSVKDFGVGLSESDIKKIFCVYFESTKDQSNDAIGAFGLGAKTPFSYTDQFSVTSTYNGVVSVYSAYIDATGIPNMTKMLSEETTDGNGVEIKMSVKTEDFFSFKFATAEQLKYFTVKPVVKNMMGFAFNPTIENNAALFADTDFTFFSSTSRAVIVKMGQIGYAVDVGQVERISGRAVYLGRKNFGVVFNANIGDIGVTASRESIEYDKKTCEFIADTLNRIHDKVAKESLSVLDKLPTAWEQAIFYNEVLRDMLHYSKVQNYPFSASTGMAVFPVTGKTDLTVQRFSIHSNSRYNMQQVPAQKDTIILLNTKKNIDSFVRKKVACNGQNLVVFVDKKDVQATKDELKKLLGGFNNFIVSDEIVVPKNSSGASRTSTSYWKYAGKGDPTTWRKSNGKPAGSFYYVVLDNLKYVSADESRIVHNLQGIASIPEFKDFCDAVMNGKVELLGFSKANEKTAKKLGGVSLLEKFNEIATSVSPDRIRHYIIKSNLLSVSRAVTSKIGSYVLVDKLISTDSDIGSVLMAARAYESKNKNTPSAGVVNSIFGVRGLNSKYQRKVVDKFAALCQTAPVLKCDHWQLSQNLSVEELGALLKVRV